MATVVTEGWDLVGVATQSLVNNLLVAAYNDNLFPENVDYSALGITFNGTIGIPVSNLDPANASGTSTMASITMPISGTLTYNSTNFPLPTGATLTITSNLQYVQVNISGNPAMQLYLDLTGNMAVYSCDLNVPSPPFWVPILNGIIAGYIQNNFTGGIYYLGTVNMSGIPADLLPTGTVQFDIQPNSTDGNSSILVMVANTSTGSAGTLNFSSDPPLLASGNNAALIISNRCLLVNMVQPTLTSSLSGSTWAANGNSTTPYTLSLTDDVNISAQYNPVVTGMSVYVNNSSQIEGDYGVTGYPLSGCDSIIWVEISGSFYLTPALSDQTISIGVNAPNGSGSIHLSAGGWVLIAFLIIATFGTLGAVVGVVVAIVVPIVITQLNLSVNMSSIASAINSSNIAFTWPAQQSAPITSIALPGDLILYLNPTT